MAEKNPEIQRVIEGAEKAGNAALAVLASNMQYIAGDVSDIKKSLESSYATKDYVDNKADALDKRVKMLEKVVYTMIGLILIAFMGAVIGGVITK
jgi:hypothetical protein